jgi:hypothetical protein
MPLTQAPLYCLEQLKPATKAGSHARGRTLRLRRLQRPVLSVLPAFY